MELDLTLLNSHNVDLIEIDRIIDMPKEYFESSEVLELNNIKVIGKIYIDIDEEVKIDLTVSGKMLLEDAISLDEVYYDYNIKIDEILFENEENLPNSLDLYEFLWENIVLEIPGRYTLVDDISKFQGEDWSLVDENDLITNDNPFKELLDKMDKE